MDQTKYLESVVSDFKDFSKDRFDKLERLLDKKAEHSDVKRVEASVAKLESTIASMRKEKLDVKDFAPWRD